MTEKTLLFKKKNGSVISNLLNLPLIFSLLFTNRILTYKENKLFETQNNKIFHHYKPYAVN